jgi:magnesium chelatase subunit D
VERDGVSVAHAASFLLVGTMNPEEGELRPQLLDRFGLTVSVTAARDVPARAEVIRRRLAYESDPAGFAARWGDADAELAARITAARAALVSVGLPDGELRRIAAVCAAFEVDGMRADLVIARTALAHAAWRGGHTVTEADVEVAARLALPHRRRRDPFDEPGMDAEALRQALEDAAQHAEQAPPQDSPDAGDAPAGPAPTDDGLTGDGPAGDGPDEGGPDDGPGGGADPRAPQAAAGQSTSQSTLDGAARAPGERAPAVSARTFQARLLQVPGVGDGAPGRRSRSRSRAGRVVRASAVEGNGLHLLGTLAAAAPHQLERGRSGPGLVLRRGDLRRAVREGKEGNLVLFAVDASGSMAARTRMSAVSGAVLSLLRDAYQRRDKVGLITFRGADAEVALPPTSSVDAAAARLRQLRTGGRTPLAGGLLRARRVLLVVVTDGRATAAATQGADPVSDALRAAALLAQDRVAAVVVDCEHGPARLGLAVRLAVVLDAACVRLDELSAEGVAGVVQAARGSGRRAA